MKPRASLSRRIMSAAFFAISLPLILTGCTTMTGSSETTASAPAAAQPTDETLRAARLLACTAFKPVTWSTLDTPGTIAGNKEHNAAWKAVCMQDVK